MKAKGRRIVEWFKIIYENTACLEGIYFKTSKAILTWTWKLRAQFINVMSHVLHKQKNSVFPHMWQAGHRLNQRPIFTRLTQKFFSWQIWINELTHWSCCTEAWCLTCFDLLIHPWARSRCDKIASHATFASLIKWSDWMCTDPCSQSHQLDPSFYNIYLKWSLFWTFSSVCVRGSITFLFKCDWWLGFYSPLRNEVHECINACRSWMNRGLSLVMAAWHWSAGTCFIP